VAGFPVDEAQHEVALAVGQRQPFAHSRIGLEVVGMEVGQLLVAGIAHVLGAGIPDVAARRNHRVAKG
jgi:hypothetical protein